MPTNNQFSPFSPDPAPNGPFAKDAPDPVSFAGDRPDGPVPLLANPSARFTRTLSALPVRPAEGTASAVADLILAALNARRFARVRETEKALTLLHPLTCHLILLHDVEAGGIELDMEDAVLHIGLEYGGTRLHRASVPLALEALGAISSETALTLTFVLARPLRDARFRALIERVNAAGGLRVRVRIQDAVQAREQEEPENATGNVDAASDHQARNHTHGEGGATQDGMADMAEKGGLQ